MAQGPKAVGDKCECRALIQELTCCIVLSLRFGRRLPHGRGSVIDDLYRRISEVEIVHSSGRWPCTEGVEEVLFLMEMETSRRSTLTETQISAHSADKEILKSWCVSAVASSQRRPTGRDQ